MIHDPINRGSRCFAVLAMLLAATAALAQDFSAQDSIEIGNYVLTEAALAKYTQAVKNLGALSHAMLAACKADDSDGASSLNDAAKRLDAVPGVKPAIQSAGLTTREYLLFSFSVFQNGMTAWAMGQGAKLPPNTSMANVTFYRAHEAALKSLAEKTKAMDCTDAGDGDSESESQE
ncbi:MAG: hypothetical protein ACRET4_14420 [Steroidobacteraceae bacterium]